MFFEIYYSYLHKESIMKEYYLTKEKIDAFASMLYQAEKSKATIEKYLRSTECFHSILLATLLIKVLLLHGRNNCNSKTIMLHNSECGLSGP